MCLQHKSLSFVVEDLPDVQRSLAPVVSIHQLTARPTTEEKKSLLCLEEETDQVIEWIFSRPRP